MITAIAKQNLVGKRFTREGEETLHINTGDELYVGAFNIGEHKQHIQLKGGGFFDMKYFSFYEDGVEFDPLKDKRFNWFI